MALWRVEEAADFLGIRPKTLYEWVRQGRVPHRKIGFNVRFDPVELESWVGTQSRGPEPGSESDAPSSTTTARSSGRARGAIDHGGVRAASAAGVSEDTRKLMAEAAVTLRDLEHEVGAELSFTRRQQLRAMASRLEASVQDLEP